MARNANLLKIPKIGRLACKLAQFSIFGEMCCGPVRHCVKVTCLPCQRVEWTSSRRFCLTGSLAIGGIWWNLRSCRKNAYYPYSICARDLDVNIAFSFIYFMYFKLKQLYYISAPLDLITQVYVACKHRLQHNHYISICKQTADTGTKCPESVLTTVT